MIAGRVILHPVVRLYDVVSENDTRRLRTAKENDDTFTRKCLWQQGLDIGTRRKYLHLRWTQGALWRQYAPPPRLRYARHLPGAAMLTSEISCHRCYAGLIHRFRTSTIRPSHYNRSQFARRGRFCRLKQVHVGVFRVPCLGSTSSNTPPKTPCCVSAGRLKSLARVSRISRNRELCHRKS